VLKVTPYAGLLCYQVDSERPGIDPYLVDLTMYWGTGCCDCSHFKFRLEKELTLQPLNPASYRCKHIVAARNYLADELINTLVRQQIKAEKPFKSNFVRSGTIQFRIEDKK
jgi:hypothetical protein